MGGGDSSFCMKKGLYRDYDIWNPEESHDFFSIGLYIRLTLVDTCMVTWPMSYHTNLHFSTFV